MTIIAAMTTWRMRECGFNYLVHYFNIELMIHGREYVTIKREIYAKNIHSLGFLAIRREGVTWRRLRLEVMLRRLGWITYSSFSKNLCIVTTNASGTTKSSPRPINGIVQKGAQVGPCNPIVLMSIVGVVNVQICNYDAYREFKVVVDKFFTIPNANSE